MDSEVGVLPVYCPGMPPSSPGPSLKSLDERVKKLESPESWVAWLRSSKGNVVSFGSAVFAAIALVLVVWPQVSNHAREDRHYEIADVVRGELKPTTETLKQLSTDMAGVKSEMVQVTTDLRLLLQNAMKTTASLAKVEFEKNLGVVSTQLAIARKAKVKVDESIQVAIRDKLIVANHSNSAFWPAASEMINYLAPITSLSLPACDEEEPAMGVIDRNSFFQGKSSMVPGATWSNCSLDLNAPLSKRMSAFITTTFAILPYVVFDHCQIRYDGGQIALLSERRSIVFLNCAFEIQVKDVPPISGKEAILQLLKAQNLGAVQIGVIT